MPMVNFSEEEIEAVLPYLYGTAPWDDETRTGHEPAISFRDKLEKAATSDTETE